MKTPLSFCLAMLCMNAFSQNNYLPGNAPTGKIGINLPSAPTIFPLEVAGGIGINFGDYLGVRNVTYKKVLMPSWDATNGDYLAFYTAGTAGAINDVEKMRITNGGRLSIGALNPEARLHVSESSPLGLNQGDYQIVTTFQNDVYGSNRLKSNLWTVRDKSLGNTNDWYTAKLHDGISIDGSYATPGTDTRTWWQRDPYNVIQTWGNGPVTFMRLDATGRLGIGNYVPLTAKLSVQDPTNAQIHAYTTSANNAGLWALNSQGNFGLRITADGIGHIAESTAAPSDLLNFKTDYTVSPNRLQVWIGGKPIAPNPHTDFMFSVKGKLVAKEIIVIQANWSDFVFDTNYELMPLADVESFYQNNRHLPNVPSASEIIENGNDLGQTDAVLLRKIEELTLYIVELEKRLNKVENK